jgi:hypothetical protein
VIGVPASQPTGDIPSASLSHAAADMFASKDKFIFGAGGAAETTDFNEFSLLTRNEFASFSSNTQNGWWQTLLQSPNDGHDTVVDPGHHGTIIPTNVHIADLHMSDFIVR